MLTSLARAQGGSSAKAYQTLPPSSRKCSALRCALQTTGQLWVAGIEIDWSKLRPGGSAARVSLPTYPFEHHRYWIEPDRLRAVPLTDSTALAPPTSQDGPLVYRRAWMPAPLMPVPKTENGLCVLFRDELGPGNEIAARLAAERHKVVVVDPEQTLNDSEATDIRCVRGAGRR